MFGLILSSLGQSCSSYDEMMNSTKCEKYVKAELDLYWRYYKQNNIYVANAGVKSIGWYRAKDCMKSYVKPELIKLFGRPHVETDTTLAYFYISEWESPPEKPSESGHTLNIALKHDGSFLDAWLSGNK
jgi:hypothetical protein